MTPAELRDLILLFDADHNGSVSLEEFKAALHVPGLDDDLAAQAHPAVPPGPPAGAPPPAPAPTPAPQPPAPAPPPVQDPSAGGEALGAEDEWAVHEAPPYAPPSAAPNGNMDAGVPAMPAIPAKTLEQMWAKVENAVSRTTGLVQVWSVSLPLRSSSLCVLVISLCRFQCHRVAPPSWLLATRFKCVVPLGVVCASCAYDERCARGCTPTHPRPPDRTHTHTRTLGLNLTGTARAAAQGTRACGRWT